MRAFTLTELLITIALIGILSVLGFAGYEKANQAAQNGICVGRLRQIGVFLNLYVADHQGKILPRKYSPPGVDVSLGAEWHRWLIREGYLKATNDGMSNGVFCCPSWPPSSPTDTRCRNPINGQYRYGMRVWAPPGKVISDVDLMPMNSIADPGDFFLVTDSYHTTYLYQGFQVSPGSQAWRVHLRHADAANTLFADGHVAAMNRDYFENVHIKQASYSGGLSGPFSIWPEKK